MNMSPEDKDDELRHVRRVYGKIQVATQGELVGASIVALGMALEAILRRDVDDDLGGEFGAYFDNMCGAVANIAEAKKDAARKKQHQ